MFDAKLKSTGITLAAAAISLLSMVSISQAGKSFTSGQTHHAFS